MSPSRDHPVWLQALNELHPPHVDDAVGVLKRHQRFCALWRRARVVDWGTCWIRLTQLLGCGLGAPADAYCAPYRPPT